MSKRSLLLVFAVALSARSIFLHELSGKALFEVLLGDAGRFDAWARDLAGGDWLGDEVFYQAPLYPYFMGLIYRLAGPQVMVVRVVQAVLGATGCTILAAASAHLLNARVGLCAGLIAALYAPAIWFDGLVQKTSLALFISALFLYALSRHAIDARPRWGLFMGLLLGLLVLVRENALVLLLPVGAWFLWGIPVATIRPDRRRSIINFVLAFVAVLAPVGARNALFGRTFLPTASNFGVNFYLGNGARSDGLYTPLVRGRGHPDFEARDARRLAERELGSELTPARVSAYWLARGVEDVSADPRRWLRLVARKAFLVVGDAEIMDAEAFEAYADDSRLLEALHWFSRFGVFLPLAVLGIAATWPDRRRLWPVWTSAAALAASIVLFFVAARFRIGVVPLLTPFAAAGALALAGWIRAPRTFLRSWPALLLATAAAFVSNRPANLPGNPRSTTASNLSSALLRRGEFDRALSFATQAVRLDPENPDALFNRGVALKAGGSLDLAAADLGRAMQLEPAYEVDVATELASIQAQRGDLEGALAALDEVVRRAPDHALAHYYRGLTLRRLNRLDEAADEYAASIRLAPDLPNAHHNLGFLRELQGRWMEAARHYRDALAADPEFALSREALARLRVEHPEVFASEGP